MRGRHAGWLWLVLAGAVLGCQKGPAAGAPNSGGGNTVTVPMDSARSGRMLAKVGQTVITVEEVEEKINAQGPFARQRFQDPARRKEYVETLIRQEVLAQEAIKRGFHKDPEVQDSLKRMLAQKLTRLEFDRLVKPEDVSKEDIQKFYEAHPEEFHRPAMVRCSAIFARSTDSPQSREQARKKVADALATVKRAQAQPQKAGAVIPDHFREVAVQVTEDADTRPMGGDLKYLTQQELADKYGEPVAKACFALPDNGALSDVVEGKGGAYVLKQTGLRPAMDRTMEQVEGQIRNRLFRDRRGDAFTAFVEGLKKAAGVMVDDTVLGTMAVAGGPSSASSPSSAISTLPPPTGLIPAQGEAVLPDKPGQDGHPAH